MEVTIKFDTEKESVDELRRLISSIQDLINKKEGNKTSQVSPISNDNKEAPKTEKPDTTKSFTKGGGRIVEYDPELANLSKYLSGRRR